MGQSLRQKVTGITIDSSSTLDMDDAIYVVRHPKGWSVQIHVADISTAAHINTRIGQRARDVVSTQYYATRSVPMFSRSLSENLFSLWNGKSRKTITVAFEVSLEGQRSDEQVYLSQCVSTAKLAYSDVPLIKGDTTHPQHQMVVDAIELTQTLLANRRKAGALITYDLNTGWITTEEGTLKKLHRRDDTIGYIIIQELMVIANEIIATWSVTHNIPILFRNHVPKSAAPSRSDLMTQLEIAVSTPSLDIEATRMRFNLIMDKASYGEDLKGHYGLNLPAYTHFTSPIRRFADLVVHRQIKAYLKGKQLPYSKEELANEASYINAKILENQANRSKIEKDKAVKRAQVALQNSEKIENLTSKEFERVCKMQIEEVVPSELFMEEFVSRTPTAPLLHLALVLGGAPRNESWKPLRQVVLNYLSSNPHDVVSILGIISAKFTNWQNYSCTTTSEGLLFKASSKAVINNVTVEGPLVCSTSKKRTESLALLALLAQYFELDLPKSIKLDNKTPEKVAIPKAYKDPQSPISALYELCAVTKIPSPSFEFRKEGVDHSPTYICTCVVGNTRAEGKGCSKASSKSDAALGVYRAIHHQ